MARLVNRSAAEHFFNDKRIPCLVERMSYHTLPDTPKMIVTVGNRELRGRTNGIFWSIIVD